MGHVDISILPAAPSDLEPVVELTLLVFFGDLGRDFGFNNNRATAFYELGIEQRQSVRGCAPGPGQRTSGCASGRGERMSGCPTGRGAAALLGAASNTSGLSEGSGRLQSRRRLRLV